MRWIRLLYIELEKNNNFEIVKLIIEKLFIEEDLTETNWGRTRRRVSKAQFINMQNNDGLTAIHYAAFRGNIRIIKYLTEEHGGDPYIKDNDGHNVIHIASQADKVNVIHFFIKNFNFDVNDRDNKDSSALHWAAYLNKEIALTYLIAWGANVNAQDTENNTPLHLAVLTSEGVQETRWVKILLLKGAKRELKNNQGQIPQELVKPGEMHDELNEVLKKQKYWSWLMLKVPYTKINRNEKTAIFFLFLYVLMNAIVGLYIVPMIDEYEEESFVFYAVFSFLLLLTFLIATLRDPGYLKRDPTIDFQSLLDNTDPYNICPDCKVIRTPRSRHWNICNMWVERFDHHWPYINNCVGYRNHAYFLAFIILVILNMIVITAMMIFAIIRGPHRDKSWSFMRNTYPVEVFYGLAGVLFISLIFFFPFTLILAVIHSLNFCKNQTTNERFARKADGENPSNLSRSMLDNSNLDNTTELLGDDSNTETLLRTTFMGPRNGSCGGNWIRMWAYTPPTQEKMFQEYV